MPQSRALDIRLDGHQEFLAAAYVAREHAAEIISLDLIGTHQCAIDKLVRNLRSKATQLVFVDEAGAMWLLALA